MIRSGEVEVDQVSSEEREDEELGGYLEPVESPPNKAGTVLARGDYRVAAVGKRAAEDVVCMTCERLDALAGLDRPQPGASIQ